MTIEEPNKIPAKAITPSFKVAGNFPTENTRIHWQIARFTVLKDGAS